MNVATVEGIVENGQIKLPADVHVPNWTKAYGVIPGAGPPSPMRVMSPRLVHLEQAQDFIMTVIHDANP
jgi:hypothetical protein